MTSSSRLLRPALPARRPLPRAVGMACLVALGLMAPSRAFACAWNPLHAFSPLPPCRQEDKNVTTRLAQGNLRLAGKIAVVAAKATMISTEIYGWAQAVGQAERYAKSVASVYGEMTTNPLGSLAGSYAIMGVSLNLQQNPNGHWGASTSYDVRRVADSLFAATFDSMGVPGLYNQLGARGFAGFKAEASQVQQTLERQMRAVGDWDRGQETLRAEIEQRSQVAAAEFAKEKSGDKGMSAAELSYLRNQMNRVRASGVLAHSRALQSQFSTLEDLTDRAMYYQSKRADPGLPISRF